MVLGSALPVKCSQVHCLPAVLIPKTIHQTLPDKHNCPSAVDTNIAALQNLNPAWRHVLHDDADILRFIQSHYGDSVLKSYNSINPLYGAARADLFRYLLMYKMGGVYLDVKSGCAQPLDSFIRDDDVLLLSRWQSKPGEAFEGWGSHIDDGVPNEIQNWHIICQPGHPLLKAVINAVLNNVHGYSMRAQGVGKFGVLRTTGPIAYTKAIEPLLCQHPHRFFDSHAAGLLYTALALPKGTASHTSLFKRHYTRVKLPLVSSGPQRPWHYAKYKLLKLLGQIA
jgi:mannosyltransferase OCH1-like enzyme